MMLGVSDRQNIRERDLAKEADKTRKRQEEGRTRQASRRRTTRTRRSKDQADDEQDSIATPETQPGKRANGVIEFRTDQWAEIYSKRIDETIAALKSKGVPVFWVGLPSIRGTKSTADAVYLNDLYRARAERAGIVYIDIWDGFVDEAGKYSNFGPDYEGQMRRLRSSDGVFFTKSGALQACALCRARNPPPDEQPRGADRDCRRARPRRRRPTASRRRVRWPGRWCR